MIHYRIINTADEQDIKDDSAYRLGDAFIGYDTNDEASEAGIAALREMKLNPNHYYVRTYTMNNEVPDDEVINYEQYEP